MSWLRVNELWYSSGKDVHVWLNKQQIWPAWKYSSTFLFKCTIVQIHVTLNRNRGRRDHMVVSVTTTYVISAYHHWSCEFESRSWRVLNTTVRDKVCQWFMAHLWFSPRTTVSSTNKTDSNDITEILLKVALKSITPNSLNEEYRGKLWIDVTTVYSCFLPYLTSLWQKLLKNDENWCKWVSE